MFRSILKAALRTVASVLFRVRVEGIQQQFTADRMLIIANHTSWLDGLLLGLFLPVNPVFVVYTGILGRPFFRLALSIVDYLTVDTSNPMAMKRVVELLKTGRPVVIFPEGRLSTTGSLMKVYDGTAFTAVKADATIVPVHLDGPERSTQTRLTGLHPRRRFPQITLTVMPATKIVLPEGLTAKARRRMAGEAMRGMMEDMAFAAARKQTLYGAFLSAAETHGAQREIMVDMKQLERPVKSLPAGDFSLKERFLMAVGLGFLVDRMMQGYTYQDLLKMVVGLGRVVSKYTAPQETVGILMPNCAATVGLAIGATAYDRVPAMLNYKAGAAGLRDACTVAAIKTVITSRAFLAKAQLEADVATLDGVRVVYLEDARAELGLRDKLAIGISMAFPQRLEANLDTERPAVVLFTSGSEGKPKGVVLSHRALMANIAQVRAVFDFSAEDRVLNALPIFHSFGLTGGTLLPLLSGMHLVLYVTPLHFKILPELAYDRNSTVLFGTSTFLANYGKHANPYDFFRLRYVVAGAEKLAEPVRQLWFEKFGKRIFEGYGATETAPVLAVNTPKAYKTGSVGQFLPGIEHKLVPVPGIANGGALYVKGPNVMSGYYRYENPGVLEPTCSDLGEGWYETGDVVCIEDGFVTIADRVKRFAKLAGEMVSLAVVERFADKASAAGMHAATTQRDPQKGEALVLFTTDKALTREMLTSAAREMGAPEIAVPRKIVVVDALPLLGTGKTDYVTLKKMAETV